jgi:acetone carboxylase gamma subunit
MRITDHLYIVSKEGGGRVVKCDCGHEFGDYRINWKLNSLVYVRKTVDELKEVCTPEWSAPTKELVELREFYCPGCLALLSNEAVPQGYRLSVEILPDLDSFYRDWLGRPLDDESPDWYQDKSVELTSQWAKETEA